VKGVRGDPRHHAGMDRRRFLLTSLAGALAAPLGAEAQQAGRVARLGALFPGFPGVPSSVVHHLHDYGWIEGRNLIVERRYDEGKGILSRLAVDLVRLSPDVLVAHGTPAALAAKGATGIIPIVITSVADPIASGLVSSLARPGGNITGVSIQGPDFAPKALQLLKEALPTLSRIAVLLDPGNPPQITQFNDQLGAAALSLHVTLKRFDVRAASDLDGVFAGLLSQPPHAVLAYPLQLTSSEWQRTIDLATKHRLPMMTFTRSVVQAGALMYFFASVDEMYHRTARYVDQIIRGAKPGDLPIEQPTRFELVINLKTAKTLGLTIPPSLLARADQIIE
jgi:putative ABC transport system substrate-binding protein